MFGFGNLPSLAQRAHGFGEALTQGAQMSADQSGAMGKLPALPGAPQGGGINTTPLPDPQTVGVVEAAPAPGMAEGLQSPAEMMAGGAEGGAGGGIGELLAALFGG